MYREDKIALVAFFLGRILKKSQKEFSFEKRILKKVRKNSPLLDPRVTYIGM